MAADITVRTGVSRPDVAWILGTPGSFNGDGSIFELTFRSAQSRLVLRTDEIGSGLTYDNATQRLRWRRTARDPRLIALGRTSLYEVKRYIGAGSSLLVEGTVTWAGGL